MSYSERCKFFLADDVAARISGKTCRMDLSPNCRRIALEEAEGGACAVNVFEASLKRKDVSELLLPPLLMAPPVSEGPVLFGNFYDCKAHLNVQTGGLLLALEGDPLIAKFVVIAGGAPLASLVGCESGAPACIVMLCICSVVLCIVDVAIPHAVVLPKPLPACRLRQVTSISFSSALRPAKSRRL